MFSEKSRLVEKKENAFYGSYKENSVLEEIHWQNRKKKRQLAMVVTVTVVLVALAIGITLAITLPPLLDARADSVLTPEDPASLLAPSPSRLAQFDKSGVSSDSPECSEVGKNVLQNLNGSAVDAAVAMTLCVGVTNPQSSGLGGGLFMVIYNGSAMHAVNAREAAPAAVNPETYEVNPRAAVTGGQAVGIPGEVAGLWEAHQHFGKVAWATLVDLAAAVARDGFKVNQALARSLEQHRQRLEQDPGLRAEFFNPTTNQPWVEGEQMTRPRLAATLTTLGQEGATAFYNGSIATSILSELSAAGSAITAQDLQNYRATWETPISYGVTGNLTMYSLPFPSSGPVVAMALGVLDGFGRKRHQDMTVADVGADTQRLAETLKYAISYRAHVADPRYANLSKIQSDLLTPDFATQIRAELQEYKTYRDPRQYGAEFSVTSTDAGTAHLSIIGPDGDAVSVTSTINLGFGAGFLGSESGVIFNNQLMDFAFGGDNETDQFGLPINPANRLLAGRRPASSMAPLIFLNSRAQPVFATGGSGGLDILPAVISTSWRALYRYMDIKQAIDYPRISADFVSDHLNYEYGLPKSIVEELKRRGHAMHRISNTLDHPAKYLGSVNAVCKTKQTEIVLANADFRRAGEPAGF